MARVRYLFKKYFLNMRLYPIVHSTLEMKIVLTEAQCLTWYFGYFLGYFLLYLSLAMYIVFVGMKAMFFHENTWTVFTNKLLFIDVFRWKTLVIWSIVLNINISCWKCFITIAALYWINIFLSFIWVWKSCYVIIGFIPNFTLIDWFFWLISVQFSFVIM